MAKSDAIKSGCNIFKTNIYYCKILYRYHNRLVLKVKHLLSLKSNNIGISITNIQFEDHVKTVCEKNGGLFQANIQGNVQLKFISKSQEWLH